MLAESAVKDSLHAMYVTRCTSHTLLQDNKYEASLSVMSEIFYKFDEKMCGTKQASLASP